MSLDGGGGRNALLLSHMTSTEPGMFGLITAEQWCKMLPCRPPLILSLQSRVGGKGAHYCWVEVGVQASQVISTYIMRGRRLITPDKDESHGFLCDLL